MPVGTCDPATRGDAFNAVTIEEHLVDGAILVNVLFGWDGVSVRPACDGPVSSIRTRNTATVPGYARLPNKKKGDKWVTIAPGTDVTINSPGQLNNLGLSNYSDVLGVTLSATPE